MKKSKFLTLFVALVYIFLFGPLFIIIATAFASDNYIAFPPHGISLKWFFNVFGSETFMKTLGISMEISIAATVIALIIGIPAAYSLSRNNFMRKSFLKNMFLSPTIVPGIVLGFALFKFIVIKLQLDIFPSLLIGHTIIVIPYIIRVIGSSLENLDYSIEEAAISLGAAKIKAFFIVVLPNISSGVIAAFMLAFINSFNNVPLSIFLTGPGVSTLPISMMSYVEYNYDPTVSALSFILMLITIVIMFVVEKTLGLSYFTK
jgi:putative spermidine/putrescine transport system permease protein